MDKKTKIILIFSLIGNFIFGITIFYYYQKEKRQEQVFMKDFILEEGKEEEVIEVLEEDLKEEEIIKEILIYVSGAVKNPSVIKISSNGRVNDAISLAGGLTADADLKNINLASYIKDGEKIYIPKIGEEQEAIVAKVQSNENSKNDKININEATLTELDQLPGIGPTMGQAILSYREEFGKFNSIEDIQKVTGIGKKRYEQIKDFIIVY